MLALTTSTGMKEILLIIPIMLLGTETRDSGNRGILHLLPFSETPNSCTGETTQWYKHKPHEFPQPKSIFRQHIIKMYLFILKVAEIWFCSVGMNKTFTKFHSYLLKSLRNMGWSRNSMCSEGYIPRHPKASHCSFSSSGLRSVRRQGH